MIRIVTPETPVETPILTVSPHCHPESPLTGATLPAMVAKAKELGRKYFAYTDMGHLSSAMKAYEQCTKEGMKFIPGIEIFFKDPQCPFVAGTPADRCKYFNATIYCRDQAAYQELVKFVSRTDLPTIEIYEEKQQLWSWKDLKFISQFNVDFVIGGVHCMVGKTMLAGAAEAGQKILEKLKEIFGWERLWIALIAEPYMKKWSQVVEIKYTDGTKDAILANDTVTTDRARRIKALDLAERSGHSTIKSLTKGMAFYEINKDIDSVKLHKGFLPLPGGDAQTKVNKFLVALANKHDVTVMVSDYAYYANKEDKIVQTMRLEGNNKLQPNYYMKDFTEMGQYLVDVLGIDPLSTSIYLHNNASWAEKYDNFSLKYDWRLAKSEGSAIQELMKIAKETGRMKWDDPKYVARLKEEIEVIHGNGVYDLAPYFLPIRNVLNHYQENGQLVGPLRGSSGGSLLCYITGITQINPFKYDLPFQRFFSMVRIQSKKLPDIDTDLESQELLTGEDGKSGYLYSRWGDKAARISTRTTIRLKSAIKDTNRYFHGKVLPEIEVLTKGFGTPPTGISDTKYVLGYENESDGTHVPGLIDQSTELQQYANKYPQEWEIVSKAMGITRAFGQHPCAFVLADVPIKNVIPTKEGCITQYEAKETESAGLIKYDFLTVAQLKDIRICLDLINKKNNEKNTVGYFTHKGEKLYIWDLPEILEVYQSTWNGSTETIFQLSTNAVRPHLMEMLPKSMMDLATLTALVRPGPADYIDPNTGRNMIEEYMLRRKGESSPDIQEMADLLPDTYGVLVFQENLNKIASGLADMDAETAELLRENMAKKKMDKLTKMKPDFLEGATKKVSLETAEKIWEQMVTFGRYGFNSSHAVGYMHIAYACMFLRHYYSLEWWAAILTNASEQEITGTFWPYVKDMVLPPDINLSGDHMVVDYANEKIRSKLGVIRGMGDATIDPIVNGRPYANIKEFVDKDVAGDSLSHKLIHVGVLDSLFPPKTGLLEKLKMYQDAVEAKAYSDKLEKAAKEGKKVRSTGPKESEIPEEYIEIEKFPIKEAAMKKAVLPSLPINMFDLGKNHSKVLSNQGAGVPMVINAKGYKTLLINGEKLQRLDEMTGETLEKDVYIAATCFVIQAKEFSFSNGTKRALKLVLDADGYVSEKVMWPEYESGKLVYPPELKKGSIITAFFRKKIGRKDMAIISVVVET
jgi:DNA-directed DNA polymerase III PolC